ncbi:Transcription factor, K-box [Cynara cardunculus var. scolymus]|uniref:Transcription factor, K-box n=1 Tax=Cynara cardunculus var. scolymus TaxID=59895 RepID=A0A103YDA7_CYNCS|nr:Transcription factor, K-box [Cynara cardunculus var. scolymus]
MLTYDRQMKGEDLQGLDLKGLDKLEAVIESGLVEVVKTKVRNDLSYNCMSFRCDHEHVLEVDDLRQLIGGTFKGKKNI